MEIHKGNYRGTVNMLIEIYEADEEYEEYLDTLSPEELVEEKANLEAQMEIIKNMRF